MALSSTNMAIDSDSAASQKALKETGFFAHLPIRLVIAFHR